MRRSSNESVCFLGAAGLSSSADGGSGAEGLARDNLGWVAPEAVGARRGGIGSGLESCGMQGKVRDCHRGIGEAQSGE